MATRFIVTNDMGYSPKGYDNHLEAMQYANDYADAKGGEWTIYERISTARIIKSVKVENHLPPRGIALEETS